MVANSEIDRDVAEWIDLLGDKVLPLNPLVVGDGKVFVAILRASEQILVEVVVRSVITEVPIKLCLVGSHTLGDAWHHDISTVSRIAGNREGPVVGGLR